jgi:hypothetical protein
MIKTSVNAPPPADDIAPSFRRICAPRTRGS